MLERFNQEDLGCDTHQHLVLEKKRRLSLGQVKSLERNFELENKLEPERKVKLAEELGLQPRQVAIWFQNRRARWKTKQLERDYGLLKASYDALKLDYDNLGQENEALTSKVYMNKVSFLLYLYSLRFSLNFSPFWVLGFQLRELKAKLCSESSDSNHSVKAESLISEFDNNVSERSKTRDLCDQKEGYENSKDGSSDSDSNGTVKEEISQMNISLCFNGSSSSSTSLVNSVQFSDSRTVPGKPYQSQLVRMEDQSLFSTEDGCNFFSVDHAPNLHWYFPEQ